MVGRIFRTPGRWLGVAHSGLKVDGSEYIHDYR